MFFWRLDCKLRKGSRNCSLEVCFWQNFFFVNTLSKSGLWHDCYGYSMFSPKATTTYKTWGSDLCSVPRQSIFHSSFLLWWSFYSCPLPIRVVVELCFLIDTLFRCINNPLFWHRDQKSTQNMKRPSFSNKKTPSMVSMRILHQPEKEVGWDSILTFSKESAYIHVVYVLLLGIVWSEKNDARMID